MESLFDLAKLQENLTARKVTPAIIKTQFRRQFLSSAKLGKIFAVHVGNLDVDFDEYISE